MLEAKTRGTYNSYNSNLPIIRECSNSADFTYNVITLSVQRMSTNLGRIERPGMTWTVLGRPERGMPSLDAPTLCHLYGDGKTLGGRAAPVETIRGCIKAQPAMIP